jgi:hypothetical protein
VGLTPPRRHFRAKESETNYAERRPWFQQALVSIKAAIVVDVVVATRRSLQYAKAFSMVVSVTTKIARTDGVPTATPYKLYGLHLYSKLKSDNM